MGFSCEFQRESLKQKSRGRCLHFNDAVRCNQIVSAHSIQKKRQLSLIAESGHVYRLNADPSLLSRTGGIPQLQKIGINKVSTFAGFCKHHDNKLFEPIDNHLFAPNNKQAALYAYRSICREYFTKENAVAVVSQFKKDCRLSIAQRDELGAYHRGCMIGFRNIKNQKEIYENALSMGDYSQIKYTCFLSSSNCPLVLSGLFSPDFSFAAEPLQDIGFPDRLLDVITFFTAPVDIGWAFCFAWHSSSDSTCIPFIGSLADSVYKGARIEDVLLRFAFSICENHAVRISWWDCLGEEAKKCLNERLRMWVDPSVSIPNDYLACGCEGIADWVFQSVRTSA
jgi:hypothetical protein